MENFKFKEKELNEIAAEEVLKRIGVNYTKC